jgi:hypothetical protein
MFFSCPDRDASCGFAFFVLRYDNSLGTSLRLRTIYFSIKPGAYS